VATAMAKAFAAAVKALKAVKAPSEHGASSTRTSSYHCNHARLTPDVHQTKQAAAKTINRRRLSRLHLGRLVHSAKGKRRLAACQLHHRHTHTPQRNRSHLVPLRPPAHSRSRSIKTLSACVSVAAARHALCHARTAPTMSRRVNIATAARSIRAVSVVLAAWNPHAKN
jgi:membrane-bound inhibitor of C-type lysozyme